MTSEEQILNELKTIMVDVFQEHTANITIDSQQQDIAGWDSLGHLHLFMAIEREFKVSSTMEEITGADSVADLVRLIKGKDAGD